ncbi:inositol hexakisphosphate kinase 1 [Biomphalaria pfeifferi]|uniref:Kinase n=1 Tax=Biomphalaria pfeifferi TaxID=112525 RepID=A0AAD8AZL5_BIOPF|nr:inositol hexakisphosphate kinase 1 [Biomphalaria pfeifferi]
MAWKPVEGIQLLAPFDHQVAGQSSMLKYDATTVCKPLIAREHFVYKTLPDELKTFTPEYRGEIEVQLSEKDGYIQLLGLPVLEDSVSCSCSSDHTHPVLTNTVTNHEDNSSAQNKCMIRVLRSGSYEFNSTTNEVFHTEDATSSKTQKLNPWSLKNHKRLLDKLLANFKHPSILDLKIGSRLHGDDASQVKVASQLKKCRETTSSTLGLRLCGMQVYHIPSGIYHSVDKFHGRTLNDQSFKQILYSFLHNSRQFRKELVKPIVDRLSQLACCLKALDSYRFYASSLLIIYDGDLGPESHEESSNDTTVSESSYHSHLTLPTASSESLTPALLAGSDLQGKQTLTDTLSDVNLQAGKLSNKFKEDISCQQHSPLNVPESKLSLNHQEDKTRLHLDQEMTRNCVKSESSSKNIPPRILLDDQNGVRKDNSYISAESRTSQHNSAVILENLLETSRSDIAAQSVPGVPSVIQDMKSCNQEKAHSALCSLDNDLTQYSFTPQKNSHSFDVQEAKVSAVKFDVKMIDFAHTTHKGFVSDRIIHSGPDTDYIRGLENLIKLFVQLMDET